MYRMKLQCRCGHQSDWANFDVTEAEMKKKIRLAQIGLRLPQHLVCPGCHDLMSVKPVVQKVN